ncbi:hypothetical protein LEP1GSC192_1439 [Leptospira sp. B5-022]|nr:hypothetical protein LEP1GSC192_1439 [Leptospira sp. B5-022]
MRAKHSLLVIAAKARNPSDSRTIRIVSMIPGSSSVTRIVRAESIHKKENRNFS